jgi:FdhD protein
VASAGDVSIEGIETHLEGVSIALRIPDDAAARIAGRRRAMEGRSGCGICGSESIEAVLAPPPQVPAGTRIRAEALAIALHALHAEQPLNARTGATHAAAFVSATGTLQLVREDVGRHNALDKLIGAMARASVDAASGFTLVTSRASYEMVMKASRAGVPMLVAISAPTALAVALAEHAGMTLVGFARAAGHVVYAYPERLVQGTTVKSDTAT